MHVSTPALMTILSKLPFPAAHARPHGSLNPTQAPTSSCNLKTTLDMDTSVSKAVEASHTFSAGRSTATTASVADGNDVAISSSSLDSASVVNITIDDTDSQNTFHGAWDEILSDKAYSGSYLITSDPSAFVSFTFKGVAAYLLIPLWNCNVGLNISHDSQPNIHLSLQDWSVPVTDNCVPVTPPQVFTITTGLLDAVHTVTIGMASDAAVAIFDALIYTAVQAQGDEPASTSADIPMPSNTTAPTTASPGSTSSSPDHAEPNIKLIVGIVTPIVTLIVAFLGHRHRAFLLQLGCCGMRAKLLAGGSSGNTGRSASNISEQETINLGHVPVSEVADTRPSDYASETSQTARSEGHSRSESTMGLLSSEI